MARYVKSGTVNTVQEINSELEKIATAQDEFLTRNGEAPNEMKNTLDMNDNRITNLPSPLSLQEPLRLADVANVIAGDIILDSEIKVFDNIAEMKLAGLLVGQTVRCKRYYSGGELIDGLLYEIQVTQTVDGFVDHVLSNNNVAILVTESSASLEQFGAVDDGTDVSVNIQAAFDGRLKKITAKSGATYIARNLSISNNNMYFYAQGSTIKNPNGVNGQNILELNGESGRVFDLVVDGNNATDAGGTLGDASFAGVVLNGRDNKAIRCTAKNVGLLLTFGDQGGTNQVGVGFGGASDDEDKPNFFVDCLAFNNGNYGFNPRANVTILRGSTWGNGTNGLGNRFSENFHVDGIVVGVQYQGNPDTDSVGMTLDTESSGSTDFQKISKNCSFKNMIIEAQESFSISSTYYSADFENIHCKGDVLIQSTIPIVAPDLGTTSQVTVKNMVVDGTFKALNIQSLKIDNLVQKDAGSLAFLIDGVDNLYFNDIETSASLARFIRCDIVIGRGLSGSGQFDVSTIPSIDISGLYMDGVTPITDQKAIQLSSTQGRITGKIKNYGYPIASSSGNSGMDLSGFEFEGCGAADGTDQNACVNFKSTAGYTLHGLKFRSCTGRLLYATNMTGGSVVGFNADTGCTGGVSIEGSSDNFMYQSNVLLGTGTLRIFAGTNMTSTAYSNFRGTGVTVSAYPAGWS